MRITRTVAIAGLAGVIGIAGLGATAVAAPAVLAAAETDRTDGPLQAVRDALARLVGDGTITQEQADRVAGTLDDAGVLGHGHGQGWHGGGRLLDLDVAAETLGLTADELRTRLAEDGATLAGIAGEQDVETSALVDALVAAAGERLEDAVADGRLTQEQADARIAALPEDVAAAVERELPGGRGHGPGEHGRGGHGPGAGPGGWGGDGWGADRPGDDGSDGGDPVEPSPDEDGVIPSPAPEESSAGTDA